MIKKLCYAQLDGSDPVPTAAQFGDSYFSRQDGEAESSYVFLTHNGLPQRWAKQKIFTIVETGFGTGLNFFVTAKLWEKQRDSTQHLYYFSVEGFPIALAELQRIHRQWPQYQKLTLPLYEYYPGCMPGFRQIEYPDLNITLVLLMGEVREMLLELDIVADALFLDGFAPAKNPDMWMPAVFQALASISREGTTFATFTAASQVRKDLLASGFHVQRDDGFGKKREMLFGSFTRAANVSQNTSPWFRLTSNKRSISSVTIVGGGLAGLTTAVALRERGLEVTLLESASEVASGASGNPIGIVMPRFASDYGWDTQFYYHAFILSVQWYNSLKKQFPDLEWYQSGVAQKIEKLNKQKIHELNLAENFAQLKHPSEISSLTGIPSEEFALIFQLGGYLSPSQLCQLLKQSIQSDVQFHFNQSVVNVAADGGKWKILTAQGKQYSSDAVVIANSVAAKDLTPAESILVEKSRGQLSILSKYDKLNTLRMPVVSSSYITPSLNQQHVLGASYSNSRSLKVDTAEHNDNIQKLNALLKKETGLTAQDLEARISFRAYSKDRMPIVGPLIDENFYHKQYADLHHGKKYKRYPDAAYVPGFYLNLAHGSRGLVSCYPLAAHLANCMSDGVNTMPRHMLERFHPGRFLIRQFKKQ